MRTYHAHRMKPVRRLYQKVAGEDYLIGIVRALPDGSFLFQPSMMYQGHGRRSSRKRWDDADAAIPRWARKRADRIENVPEEG